jgi:hypothetical protein
VNLENLKEEGKEAITPQITVCCTDVSRPVSGHVIETLLSMRIYSLWVDCDAIIVVDLRTDWREIGVASSQVYIRSDVKMKDRKIDSQGCGFAYAVKTPSEFYLRIDVVDV